MGPWQTGREGVWSLAERVGSQGGGSGALKKDQGLNGSGGRNSKKRGWGWWVGMSENVKKKYDNISSAKLKLFYSASFFIQYLYQ